MAFSGAKSDVFKQIKDMKKPPPFRFGSSHSKFQRSHIKTNKANQNGHLSNRRKFHNSTKFEFDDLEECIRPKQLTDKMGLSICHQL